MDINNDLDNIITKSTLIYEKALKKLSISPVVSKISDDNTRNPKMENYFLPRNNKDSFYQKIKKR